MLAGVTAFRVCRPRAPILAAAGVWGVGPAFHRRSRPLPAVRSVPASLTALVINLRRLCPDSAMEAAGQVNYRRNVRFRIGAKIFTTDSPGKAVGVRTLAIGYPGTIAPIVVLFVTTKDAAVPLKETAEAFVKFNPVILTVVPGAELVGVKLTMFAGK